MGPLSKELLNHTLQRRTPQTALTQSCYLLFPLYLYLFRHKWVKIAFLFSVKAAMPSEEDHALSQKGYNSGKQTHPLSGLGSQKDHGTVVARVVALPSRLIRALYSLLVSINVPAHNPETYQR